MFNDCKVENAFIHALNGLLGLDEVELEIVKLSGFQQKPVQHSREIGDAEGWSTAQGQAIAIATALQFVNEILFHADYISGFAENSGAGGSKNQSHAGTLEELMTKMLFEKFDALRDGWLSHVQDFGGS